VKNPRLSAVKVSAEFNETFSTSISPELFDKFSEQLDYMDVLPIETFKKKIKKKKKNCAIEI
jgi:hypothetical protein